ncbi:MULTISPECIES: heme lyase CcmF/NrfE family subunit [unclassified Rhizobium]|uniref:heme lyase CcmF/NrfE family subunit n=1 Tax=unclassified Rhizobium TaxID=2613769 RepID=UPI000DE0CE48|nr:MULTISPECIES: heme lyase CcmF/NrfE family subunit [unclassified Rhizobium]MBB3288085.1 cytochrome c-type biogenesis protein CcmF [Rhizobium sp. BK252]MBB3403052.1 cytochrome c-type biogenesis protein CcmF [Rhizobium sp. BK289]MBB3415629.1 cytochrome c-type biogenesis protein CcmF [Rhizobium sp. BK284]MBB3483291.1 cytochrome c-type biogenesis protein CcmF [Rhizobium sp. BK347]MDK4724132.1 heme lyase CcmF/NrfE family subunit [Rhizobium sp. CNPSo 3968]
MIIELGHYALVLALATALIVSILPVIGAKRGDVSMMDIAPVGAILMFLLVAFSFGVLTYAYVASDFSVLNVWANSHSLMPLIFKISGVWGNHEGSMMLWLLILALFSAFVALFGRNLPDVLRANVLAVQSWISSAFLVFILLTSNPFIRLNPAPAEGKDLNPVLQDIGLAIHPPLLYLGYVGFSVCFSFAVAALLEGRIDAAWARWVRPWTLAAWSFLTLGIAMGSYWAYYELGWGGWWFWDPVENASFMPWLAGTALLHSALVMEKRDALKIWTVLLAILTFSLSLLGTFLVRSGVLTSVHSFASDPTRGIFILCILLIFIGGALSLFAFRAPKLAAGGLFAPISREGALVLNNLVLTVACGTVLTGTLYPLALETLTGDKISVGPPFFNMTFGLLMTPILIAVPFGPLLAWKRGDLLGALQRLYVVAGLAFIAGLVLFYIRHGGPVLAVLGLAAGFFLIFGALADLWYRAGVGKVAANVAWRRFSGLPRSAFGTALAHAGLGVSVLGIIAVTTFEGENITSMKPGETAELGGYSLRFEGVQPGVGPNFTEDRARFTVSRGGVAFAEMSSAKRVFTASRAATTESGILTIGLSQLYVSVGDASKDGGMVVRIWWKPFILCIWLGALVMAIGGFVSLSDRRLRVGAPSRKAKPVRPVMEPAE